MKKIILKILRFASFLFITTVASGSFTSCEHHYGSGTSDYENPEYPADVAVAWIEMQHKLFVGTPGILPHVAGRTYAYVGLTMYESIVPGMEGYQSLSQQLNGELKLPPPQQETEYYWPASANAALASILKDLLPHTTQGLLSSIDSLETDFNTKFLVDADTETVQRSVAFGRQIAMAIFEWSKTDGGHEAYKNPFSDTYVAPTGPGQWEPTGEFPFSQPVYPHWGNNRTFIAGLPEATQPPPPPDYSEEPGSEFYEAVKEIYMMSQNLSQEDLLTAKFWGYEPLRSGEVPEYEDVSHAANMVTDMVILKKLSLYDAAVLYCKHSVAGNEAGISCVRAKFHYNLVRPITYIRNVLGHSEWLPVIPTPPFPEYTSAHAATSMSFASILSDTFGQDFEFTDHSFDDSYGPRHFDSFEAYAEEAALSRLFAGIHYRFAMDEGLKQGRQIATMVNHLKFKK